MDTLMDGFVIEFDRQSLRAFEANLLRLNRELPDESRKCASQIAEQVLNDCLMEPPTVPKAAKLGGFLRASGTHEVKVEGGEVTILVGYNTAYAAVMHEGAWKSGPLAGVQIKNWSEPGSGSHFLITKLQRHASEYVQRWANLVAEKLGLK